jgi:hypothetical protein
MSEASHAPTRTQMSARDRRRVLIAIAVFALVTMIGGVVYSYVHRNETICRDGRPPVSQKDDGLGQITYRCHDGQIVERGLIR